MTLVIAHRGDTRADAENTLSAITAAAAGGADAVEVDVRLTADAVPVLHHDLTLARTHGLPVGVSCVGAQRLRRIAPQVPTLAEALEALRPFGIPLVLDLRSRAAAAAALDVVETVTSRPARATPGARGAGLPVDAAVWFCGRPGPLALVRRRDPSAVVLLSWRRPLAPSDRLVSLLTPSLFNPWHGLVTRRLVDSWQRRGIGVGAWTVDDAARRDELRGFGVGALITNTVAEAVVERSFGAYGRRPGHLAA